MTPPDPRHTLARRFRRALVTGGAGFIGSHVVEALVALGLEVVVLDDLRTGSGDHVPDGVPLILADVAAAEAPRLIADARPDLVIHAAAHVSVPASVQGLAKDREVNLTGTEHVLHGARLAGASRIVFLSSGGAVYGEATLADERTLPAPMSPYGVHKLAAESYVRLSGLPYGIARFSNVYGPRQRVGLEGGVVAIFMDALLQGRPVTLHGGGRQTRDFLYVQDAVSGLLSVVAAAGSGTWNVATETSTSLIELLSTIERTLGCTAHVHRGPSRPGDVETSSLCTDRIRSELGWGAIHTLRDGLRAMLTADPDALTLTA